MYSTPSRWSYSCWKMRASQSRNFLVTVLPLAFWYVTLICNARSTYPELGMNEWMNE